MDFFLVLEKIINPARYCALFKFTLFSVVFFNCNADEHHSTEQK